MVVVYFAFSATSFGITAILAQREIKGRKDFKRMLFGGTLNVYLYYRHLRNRHEKRGGRFKLFLLATLNSVISAIFFVITAFSR
jgi:hypothetical protein